MKLNLIQPLIILAGLGLGMKPSMSRAAEPSSHIVFMIGEEGYHTAETLPQFAEKDLKTLGCRISIVNADAADKNDFPGLVAALRDADLLFVSVRRRTPRQEQLEAVRTYLAAGKPLVGIRTTCHAFAPGPKDKAGGPGYSAWPDFDAEVLGGHYSAHLGKEKVLISLASGAGGHPILEGVSGARLFGTGGLYKVSPLEKDATALLMGTVPGHPAEPVAWVHLYGARKARIFYTSLGHPDDFKNPDFHKLLVNGVMWALGR